MKAGNESLRTDSSRVPLKVSRRRQCRIHVKIHPDHWLHLSSYYLMPNRNISVNDFKRQIKWIYTFWVFDKTSFSWRTHIMVPAGILPSDPMIICNRAINKSSNVYTVWLLYCIYSWLSIIYQETRWRNLHVTNTRSENPAVPKVTHRLPKPHTTWIWWVILKMFKEMTCEMPMIWKELSQYSWDRTDWILPIEEGLVPLYCDTRRCLL